LLDATIQNGLKSQMMYILFSGGDEESHRTAGGTAATDVCNLLTKYISVSDSKHTYKAPYVTSGVREIPNAESHPYNKASLNN